MVDQKLRLPASTGKKSEAGQLRNEIYKRVWSQIKLATDAQCWLEVITLTESVIADRLEARLAHIAEQQSEGRRGRTAGQAAWALQRSHDAGDEVAMRCYQAVAQWCVRRNTALHELAKLFETTTGDWNSRYSDTKKISEDGVKLAKSVSTLVRRLNKPPSNTRRQSVSVT
jgi:hypothetical protein